eukprot:TRINITY_DN8250_c0_g1_i8.p1 TRINITY_DN8250_c0_g1~~TRINITY_DN8250_c0_g1_i8.p1  ORF type:complete len:212 (+),score=30.48 TRINITY_DN8250_c0_g1_i8:413-1048(+)
MPSTLDINNRIDRFIIIERRYAPCSTNRNLERHDLCFDTVLHKKCLIKTLTKTQLKPSYRNKNTVTHRLLQNQVATLKKVTHKNLVKLNEVIMDTNTDKLFFVSSYSPNTSLQGVLSRVGRIEEVKAREYFRQILEALYYCYTVGGVIHRNITLENILILDANDRPQLMEMGQAFLVENEDLDTPEEYLSLIHICRCRRYAVCRSRWSPYH